MSMENPRSIFGIHDVRAYDRNSFESLAYWRVLGAVNFDFSGEFAELRGGSQIFVWEKNLTKFNSSLSIVGREYHQDQMAMALDANVTEYAADADGDVIEFVNRKGSSVKTASAGVGIASIAVIPSTGAANLKEGLYVIKATAANKVKVYGMSSAGFVRGAALEFGDMDGVIGDELTITASTATPVTALGVQLMGANGTIGMTIGDTASFYIQKPHSGAFRARIGGSPINFDDVGLFIGSETVDGMTTFMNCFRVKVAGMSIPFPEKEYAEYTMECALQFDSTVNGIADFYRSLKA